MTWMGDTSKNLTDEAKAKLLEERAALVVQIEELKSTPIGRAPSAVKWRQEDLIAIAKKVTAIDKKLGRA